MSFLPLAIDQHLREANAIRGVYDAAVGVLRGQTSLVQTLQESFYNVMARMRDSGRDAAIVLTHLAEAETERLNLSVDDFAFLATSFQWDSPLRMPSSYTVEQQEFLNGLLAPVSSSSLPEGVPHGFGDADPSEATETVPSTSI